ncbi:MAG: signal recognition particle protein [Alphaproteobacteria bacterium]|nr:signal recognition particle protein [Alphaproteobacteria bacterium]
MFEALTDRLGQIFEGLTRRGALTESDVTAALRDVRVALLEADVALPVVKKLIDEVRERAIGTDVIRSVTPGQMVVKVVHDHLVQTLGAEADELRLAGAPPVAILMVGLQGSGKTTTTAKIGFRLKERERKKVLMASLDTQRPAAQQQLKVLGEQAGVPTLPIIAGEMPVDIARRALTAARLGGYDVVLLDTAGRLHVDEALMAEAAAVADVSQPAETLLVVDALTGQDAVKVAERFTERLKPTGVVMTRMDGDARGGAALSMRAVTGCPIKLIGVGEKMDALDQFHPARVASRILGMGDVVSLVEKAAETIDRDEAAKLEARVKSGKFDMNDLAQQFRQMRKMGGMDGLLAYLPGVQKAKAQLAANKIDDRMLARQEAMILSMTKAERKNVKLLNGSRKRRIAAGSGTSVPEVNRLVKQFIQMADVMKKVGRMDPKLLRRHGIPGLIPRA